MPSNHPESPSSLARRLLAGEWQPWWTPCGSFLNWLRAWIDAAPWRIRPADRLCRCVMGWPVQDSVCCRRPATYNARLDTELWCRHHARGINA